MNKDHPNYKAVIAWANGEPIQVSPSNGQMWEDMNASTCDEWSRSGTPFFTDVHWKYRPKPKLLCKYRISLHRSYVNGSYYTYKSSSADEENQTQRLRSFKRWLTDWVEVYE